MKCFVAIPIIAGLSLLFSSCSKNESADPDESEPLPVATLQISSPVQDAVYNNGDSVSIKATAISTASIHGYDLAIRDTKDTTKSLYFIHIHDHNDTININEKWKSAVATTLPANLQAEITLYIDHEGHTQKTKVGFRVQ
jgi:hypothetical protein